MSSSKFKSRSLSNRLSINQVSTYRWEMDEDVYHALRNGFSGLGVWHRKVDDFGEERSLDLLQDSGLTITSLSWAGGFTGSTGQSYNESMAEVRRLIQLAAEMQAEHLVLYVGGRNNHTNRHASRLLYGAIDALLPYAEEWNVPLAIEPITASAAANSTFINDLQVTFDLLNHFSNPHLKLIYDTYHFPLSYQRLDLLEKIAPYIGVVQLADRVTPPDLDQERCRLGTGLVPFEEILRTLLNAGYRGMFDIKIMGTDVSICGYKQLLEESYASYSAITDSLTLTAA